jgi:hypothetical protein
MILLCGLHCLFYAESVVLLTEAQCQPTNFLTHWNNAEICIIKVGILKYYICLVITIRDYGE